MRLSKDKVGRAMVKATQYLNDAKQAFEDRDFNKAKELSDKIIRMKAAAFEANKLINEIKYI